jgi:hypothetical protein
MILNLRSLVFLSNRKDVWIGGSTIGVTFLQADGLVLDRRRRFFVAI